MDKIQVSTNLSSTEAITKAKQTPSGPDRNEGALHLMLDTDPLDGLIRNADNYIEATTHGYETSYGLNSTSYSTSIADVNTTPIDLTDYKLFHFDTIAATVSNKIKLSDDNENKDGNTKLVLEYGYCLNQSDVNGVWTATKQDNFSDPMLDQGDYNFCFYGAINYETMGDVEDFCLSFSMTDYYGSYKYYNDRFNFEFKKTYQLI